MARLDRAIQLPRVRAAKGGARLLAFVSDKAKLRHAVLLRSFKCAPNRLIRCFGTRLEVNLGLWILSRYGLPISIERLRIGNALAVPDVGSIAKDTERNHVARSLLNLTRTSGKNEEKT